MHFHEAKPIMSNICDPAEVPPATHCFSCAAWPFVLHLWPLPFASFNKPRWSSVEFSMILTLGGFYFNLVISGQKKIKATHDGEKGKTSLCFQELIQTPIEYVLFIHISAKYN